MAYPGRPNNFNRQNQNHANRVNHFIRSREVLVIDSDGKSLGVIPTPEALTVARKRGLDLVEVSPNANPPVCKILDFGKFRYEQAKKERDNKKAGLASKMKELQFHMNIDPHDYGIKLKHAERFMWKGMKVKFSLFLRGREMLHKQIAEDLMKRCRADLAHIGTTETEPKLVGKNITMMLNPLPQQKRVLKLNVDGEEEDESEEDDSSEVSDEK